MTLLAAYNFDEASGAVVDVTGNSHGFTPAGQTVRTASAAGHTDKGLSQTSNSDDDGPTLFGEAASRTLMMWVKTTADFTGWAFEWHHVALDTGLWGLLCLSGNLGFRGRNAGGTTAHASVARPTDNAWHHFAGTYDGTNVRLYVDGTLSATVALSGGIAAATAPAVNAFNTSIMGNQTVIIDDVRVYDTALDAATITTLMGTPVTAGGTSYTQTPADTEGLTDTQALEQGKGVPETEGLTDSAALAQGKPAADQVGLTDSTSSALGLGQFPAETEGITDSAALAVGLGQSDLLGLTDSAALARTLANADTLGMTDTAVTDLVSAGSITQVDPLALTDTAAIARTAALTDVAGLTDSAGVSLGVARLQADLAGMTDASAAAVSRSAGQIDPFGLTDSISIQLILAVEDALSLVDTTTGLPSAVSRDLTLVGAVKPGRWDAHVEPNRWAATLKPNRWKGAVPWPD